MDDINRSGYPPTSWWQPARITADPNGPLGRPPVAIDPLFVERPLFESFARVAARQPDAPCLASGPRRLSYGECYRQAEALAARIASHTAPGDGVGILFPDGADIAIAQLACLACGRVGLLINAAHPLARINGILAQAAPRVLLAPAGMALPAMPAGRTVLHPGAIQPTGSGIAFTPAARDAPVVVIYTSGSTGDPKGYVRTQEQVLYACRKYSEELRIGPDDRLLSLFSLTNGTGLTCLMLALAAGLELHVAPPANQGLRGVLDLVSVECITVVCAIPSLLRAILALPGAGEMFRGVRAIFSVGEPLTRADLQAWRRILPADCALYSAYGMTEASGLATWFLPRDPNVAEARLPLGYPSALHEFAIATPTGEPEAAGAFGELWIRGRLITQGEWRNGRVEPGRASADPTDRARRILRTNDLVRLRADGLLELAGRADHMIKVRGNRVEPAEIEDALRRHPGIADVAILPARTETEISLIAHVVPAPGALQDRAALMTHLRALLAAYMIPARIEFLSALPRLANGKVDARRLSLRSE